MKAAIFHGPNQPLTIEQVDIDDPRDHEVLVRTAASGVCHSDLHFVDGLYPYPAPAILGHEAAGVVEKVGKAVTYLEPGDHVISCPSVFCGFCEECMTGNLHRCSNRRATQRPKGDKPRLSQGGKMVRQFSDLSTYAEKMLLHEHALVKITKEIPLDRAALIGCGVTTGVGAVLNTAKIEPGSTVAVFGCGGVGLSIVQGARIGGARQIIAVDMFAQKAEMAKRAGATDFVNSSEEDPVKAVRRLTGGLGVDHAFEAVGLAKLCRQAIESLAIRGTATIVGVLPPDATIEFPWMAIRPECKVQTSRMGGNRFRYDIPMYLDLYRQGRLDLDQMVTKTGRLDDINEAFRAMKAGEVARTVLMFD